MRDLLLVFFVPDLRRMKREEINQFGNCSTNTEGKFGWYFWYYVHTKSTYFAVSRTLTLQYF